MSKLIDLTGNKYGRLTVLHKDNERKSKGSSYWICQCDCGTIKSVKSSSLRRGEIQSCGCYRNERIAEAKKEYSESYMIGRRFGNLVVQQRSPQKGTGGKVYWICQCDCGQTVIVPSSGLLCKNENKTVSCGCKTNLKDISNQKFGKLTALYPINRFSGERIKWHCLCECGNECDIDGASLRAGYTHSCGCINYSIGEQNILKILKENNIQYIKEYTCSELNRKRFDFALLQNNKIVRLIEFDGEQHFKAGRGTWDNADSLEKRQFRDNEKNQYALSHNIPLVRIPYWERDKITLEMIMGDQYLVKGETTLC